MNSYYLWQALAMPGPSLIPEGRSLKHVRLTRARLAGIRDQNLPPVGLVHSVLNCIIDMGIAGLHRGTRAAGDQRAANRLARLDVSYSPSLARI